ncbi:MAG: hypothetical protein WAU01_04475, partial [Saprospiraceae bacterium]
MFLKRPSIDKLKFHHISTGEKIGSKTLLNLKAMKSILQTFVFLTTLFGAQSLWGQCIINAP